MERIGQRLQHLPPLAQETLIVVMKFSVVIFATVAVFFQDLVIIFTDAIQSETTSYILAVPFLLIYLIYRKRKMVEAVIPLESPKLFRRVQINEVVGAFLFLASFLLYWYGSYTFTPLEYHIFALPIFASACILILFNTQMLRQLLFPIAFLFLLVPPPSEIVYNLGALLSTISSELAYNLLRMKIVGFPVSFGYPVSITGEYGNPVIFITQQDGTTISLAIDIACSGIYSQIGFLIFALFIAYIIRDKTWKKTAIFLLGFPLIYLLNVLRITTIGIIGYHYGEDLALYVFHLLGGWMLIFLGTLFILATSEKLFRIQIVGKQTEKCLKCNQTQLSDRNFCLECGRIQRMIFNKINKRTIAKTIGVILCAVLIVSIQTPVFALTEGPAEVILQSTQGEEATTKILPQVSDYTLDFMYRDETFEQRARQDRSLVYAYFPNNDTKEIIWVALEIASVKSSLHTWETCLITWPLSRGYQPRVEQIELRDVQLVQNPPIKGRFFIFQYKGSNSIQAVFYWYETSIFKVNSSSEQKHVKISLIAYPDSLEDLPEMENQLLIVATTITSHWQPIKMWSQVSLLISQNGDKLFTTTILLLGVVLVFYVFGRRKERRQKAVVYQKLSKNNKQIIEAVRRTEKSMLPTLNGIAKSYARMTGKPPDKEALTEKLSETEKTGLIKSEIANLQDEPIRVWRTEFSL